jgi:acetyl esterase/lipase
MITNDTPFRDIINLPELQPILKYWTMIPKESLLTAAGNDSLPEYFKKQKSVWIGSDMVAGLDFLAKRARVEPRFMHQVYSGNEIAGDISKSDVVLFHFPGIANKKTAIICAGGAYISVASMVEAFPTAKRLNELGLNVFVLNYRVNVENTACKAEQDLRAAIRFILDKKQDFGIDGHYAVFGFSAGGHLAAELGTDNHGYAVSELPVPDMLCLCYTPVNLCHLKDSNDPLIKKMLDTMFGHNWNEATLREHSPVFHVDKNYPPVFCWATKADEIVPFRENTLAMTEQLKKSGVPFRLKAVKQGAHGLGAANGTEAEGWIDEAVSFWNSLNTGDV